MSRQSQNYRKGYFGSSRACPLEETLDKARRVVYMDVVEEIDCRLKKGDIES